MKKNAVIIGGGLGGLFCGALLAKEGVEVTVIEKNANIGGGLQSFRRFGTDFDTGMHMLGGFNKSNSLYKICDYLGILNQLKIRAVDHDCADELTYLSCGDNYRIPAGRENLTAYFQNKFPHENENIARYVEKLYAITDNIDFYYLRPEIRDDDAYDEMFNVPADKLVSHFIRDEKLRDMLSYMTPLLAGLEGRTPAHEFALINTMYFDGQFRFEGPSIQLAHALVKAITDNGGRIVAGTAVKEILIEEKIATKAITEDGREFAADYFISDIHPVRLMEITNGLPFTKISGERLRNTHNSYSAFCVYVKLKSGTFKYINHPSYCIEKYGNAWKYDNYVAENWPECFVYITPCRENQGEFADSLELIAMMPFSACKKWETTVHGRRNEEYEGWKRVHCNKIIDKFKRIFPDFDRCIDKITTASPLTIRDFYNVPDGAMYGISKDCRNMAESFVSVRTKVGNLFLTGQNVNMHGCCGVPLTAVQTAETIVGRNVIVDKINAHANK